MTDPKFDLDRRLFPLALSVMRCNWLPFSIAALLLLAANIGQNYLDASLAFVVLRSLIIMIVGFSAYRVLLSGGQISGRRAVSTADGRIPWRYIGVMMTILTPILILGIIWTAPGASGGPSGFGGIAFGLVMVIAYANAYILLGTALPAVAERGDVPLSEALARGRGNYREIARAMLIGPWVFRAGTMVTLIGASFAGITVDLFDIGSGAFQPAALVPMLMFTTSHVFAETLTAIVLMRAYRRYPAMPPSAVTA
jgi:hypothetical protein